MTLSINTQQALTDAQFCLNNPDVLHTPAQHRQIISELVAHIDVLQATPHLSLPNQPTNPPKEESFLVRFMRVL
jgi:hypothetical protein